MIKGHLFISLSLVFISSLVSGNTNPNKIIAEKREVNTNPSFIEVSYNTICPGFTTKYGRIVINYSLKRLIGNESDVSSLYFLDISTEFQPGSVINGMDSRYNTADQNLSGSLDTKLHFAYVASPTYSADLTECNNYYRVKDYYPSSSESTVNLSSTFSAGLSFGYSQNDGFYVGGSLGYSYSKTINVENPCISSQSSNQSNVKSSVINQANWIYTYAAARAETFHLHSGVIFEMLNLTNLQVSFDITGTMKVYEDHFWNWEQEIYDVNNTVLSGSYKY